MSRSFSRTFLWFLKPCGWKYGPPHWMPKCNCTLFGLLVPGSWHWDIIKYKSSATWLFFSPQYFKSYFLHMWLVHHYVGFFPRVPISTQKTRIFSAAWLLVVQLFIKSIRSCLSRAKDRDTSSLRVIRYPTTVWYLF